MGYGGTVFIEPRGQNTGVRNEDTRGDERSEPQELWDHRVLGLLRNTGHCSGWPAIPPVRHKVVLIDVSVRGSHAERHDAISDDLASKLRLEEGSPQGLLISHVAAS